ncbi:MAG: DeoR family transcriptional regulator [Spirochaetes bacterium]|nr:MAG: DeoR family transcriptional regulator [Spirochaetota bacterium]
MTTLPVLILSFVKCVDLAPLSLHFFLLLDKSYEISYINGVISFERQEEILKLLESKGKVTVNELARLFNVSKVTIRSDFESLENKGFLIRTHGGAISAENRRLIRMVSRTIDEFKEQKDGIARQAVSLIQPGATIIIDSGSTTAYLARYIKEMQLTVITNSLLVSQELSHCDNIELLISGGALRRPSMAIIGEATRFFLSHLNADLLFLGATSFSFQKGISCTNLIEAETKRSMIKSSEKVCLLADSSKKGKVSMAHVCDWEDVDIFITDSLNIEEKEALHELGVEVIVTTEKSITPVIQDE